jgi:hypothetical protein
LKKIGSLRKEIAGSEVHWETKWSVEIWRLAFWGDRILSFPDVFLNEDWRMGAL